MCLVAEASGTIIFVPQCKMQLVFDYAANQRELGLGHVFGVYKRVPLHEQYVDTVAYIAFPWR